MAPAVRRSVCPYDCPDACGLMIEVDGDRVVRVRGDPEHPYTRGVLCPKMQRYQETVHSPRRLTQPLLRDGPKGAGVFRTGSWDEALETIAGRWRSILSAHGAEAVLPYSYAGTMGLIQRNAGHPFFHKLGASRLARTICTPAKEVGWRAVMGDTPACHPDAAADSDLVILWSVNAVATNIHFLHALKEARSRGASVWVVDTYETPTAAFADRVILVRPGSDGALALGLMHLIVRAGSADRAFLAEHVLGFAELEEQVLPDYPPEQVAELTGLTVPALESLAAEYAAARAPFIRVGGGLSRYANGAMTVRTVVCLPALVGAYGKRGGGCFVGTSTGAAFAMEEVTREDFLPRPTRVVNMNQLGAALNDLRDPPVMSLYVYSSNPAVVAPDQNQVIRGLLREDLFTVVHERFLTDTARYADIVLPATTMLEQSDLYRSYGTYCLQRARPAIPPVGQSRPNWEVFGLLADALGFDEPFFRQSADDLIDRLLSVPSPFRDGIDQQALAQGKAVEMAAPAPAQGRYGTGSGRIEVLNESLPEPLPRYLPPRGGAYPFRLMTAPSLFTLNSSFYERDALVKRQRGMRIQMNPQDAQAKGLIPGARVIVSNDLGEVEFLLDCTPKVPRGVVVAEGVWWTEFAPGSRSVNALTSQALTDMGAGSTFYDNTVDVRARG